MTTTMAKKGASAARRRQLVHTPHDGRGVDCCIGSEAIGGTGSAGVGVALPVKCVQVGMGVGMSIILLCR